MSAPNPMRNGRCHAQAHQTGVQCKKLAIPGGTVCRYHGGAAPQVREAAARYLLSLAYPAAVRIGELIQHKNGMIALAASKDVLDRVGYKAVERVESDGRMIIEIELVDRAQRIVEHDT